MTNLDNIFKSRDITKIHLVKAMVFPVSLTFTMNVVGVITGKT